MIPDQVATVVNDRHTVGRVNHQAHAVGDVLADINLRSAPFEQRFLRYISMTVGKLTFGEFHGDVFQHVAHTAPCTSGRA